MIFDSRILDWFATLNAATLAMALVAFAIGEAPGRDRATCCMEVRSDGAHPSRSSMVM